MKSKRVTRILSMMNLIAFTGVSYNINVSEYEASSRYLTE